MPTEMYRLAMVGSSMPQINFMEDRGKAILLMRSDMKKAALMNDIKSRQKLNQFLMSILKKGIGPSRERCCSHPDKMILLIYHHVLLIHRVLLQAAMGQEIVVQNRGKRTIVIVMTRYMHEELSAISRRTCERW